MGLVKRPKRPCSICKRDMRVARLGVHRGGVLIRTLEMALCSHCDQRRCQRCDQPLGRFDRTCGSCRAPVTPLTWNR